MQYDENAEKYGYEGEMTPLKCDELKEYKADVTIPVYGTIADAEVYLKKDVDAAIAELKQELKHSEDELESYFIFEKEIKQKLRAARRALYKACANWAHHRVFVRFNANEKAWENMERKCLKKAEEYK